MPAAALLTAAKRWKESDGQGTFPLIPSSTLHLYSLGSSPVGTEVKDGQGADHMEPHEISWSLASVDRNLDPSLGQAWS